MLQPAQFHGEPCNFSDKEVEDCVANRPCRTQVQCEGFVCAQTGINEYVNGRENVSKEPQHKMLEGQAMLSVQGQSHGTSQEASCLEIADFILHVIKWKEF